MRTLIKPAGFFDLKNSDRHVGSYISKEDVKKIFEIYSNKSLEIDCFSEIPFEIFNGKEYVDEHKLHVAWNNNKIKGVELKKGVSLDELILLAIIKITFPEAIIEDQVRINRYKMDLKVTLGSQTVFIEFDGPSHFSPTRYGNPAHEPFYKKNLIEDKTGYEVINWAFWIQRCSTNVRAIFSKDIEGLGALWSSSCYFGNFYFDNSAEIIEKINDRFNIKKEQGYGYFYEKNSLGIQKPEHPIVANIIKDPEKINLLLPKGYKSASIWLPSNLLALI